MLLILHSFLYVSQWKVCSLIHPKLAVFTCTSWCKCLGGGQAKQGSDNICISLPQALGGIFGVCFSFEGSWTDCRMLVGDGDGFLFDSTLYPKQQQKNTQTQQQQKKHNPKSMEKGK